jgi:hypothetical protein
MIDNDWIKKRKINTFILTLLLIKLWKFEDQINTAMYNNKLKNNWYIDFTAYRVDQSNWKSSELIERT